MVEHKMDVSEEKWKKDLDKLVDELIDEFSKSPNKDIKEQPVCILRDEPDIIWPDLWPNIKG